MNAEHKSHVSLLLIVAMTMYLLDSTAGHWRNNHHPTSPPGLTYSRFTRYCGGMHVCDNGHFSFAGGRRVCLDGSRVCDGTPDCPLHDDEKWCGLSGASGFEPRRVRTFYIQAEPIEWDYLPEGMNLADTETAHIQETLTNGQDRVGSVFTKYVYRRYTDDTFSVQIPNPAHMGIVGPLMRVEDGEQIKVFFKNIIPDPVSIHPHGTRYDKKSEGALYLDGTGAAFKVDDGVPTGTMVVLVWEMTAEYVPTEDDATCIPMAYHSHVNTLPEVNAGLLGLLIVCPPGTLDENGARIDATTEAVIYVDGTNEGESLATLDNLNRCGNATQCLNLYTSGDEAFMDSLLKHSINGYSFANMPPIDVCVGETVVWYLFSIEADVHSVTIHGHSFSGYHHRSAVQPIWPATFRTATTVSTHPGRWMISNLNSALNTQGMRAYMNANVCPSFSLSENLCGVVRTFYLAAENDIWDYAPSGQNLFDGGSLTATGSTSFTYFTTSDGGQPRIGGVYRKSRFFAYDDATFTNRSIRTAEEDHHGFLGPKISVEVGDTIEIVLNNLTPYPVSIYLQGVTMPKAEDGTWERDTQPPYDMQGKVVQPSNQATYTFTVPWSVGPMDNDPDCLTYMYYSIANFERDLNSGLFGPLVVCRKNARDATTGKQKNIEKEMFLLLASMDENLSWHIDYNINTYASGANAADPDFIESNIMRSINGRSYGNLEALDVCKRDDVVWHVMSFGATEGLHSVTWNGNNVMIGGIYRDSHVVISGYAFSAAMTANNVGTWSVSCHTNSHFMKGMKALYTVDDCGDVSSICVPSSGVTRTYYIAANERPWNAAPITIHPVTGANYSDSESPQYDRVRTDGQFVGSIYIKALYSEYTDATFGTEVIRGPDEEHLGILGPVIRANVGDLIRVEFKNNASRAYSMHPMRLLYDKDSEGMAYLDGTPGNGDSVAPGDTYVYTWEVPVSAGPVDTGPNCIGSMYHSAVDPVRDTYAGMVGPIVICKERILGPDGVRTDTVKRELFMLFSAIDENQSWYLELNMNETNPVMPPNVEESNKYDGVNGYVYNNVPGLVVNQGDNVAWYVMTLGTDEDQHTIHWHGHTFIYRAGTAHRGDVMEVFPGTYETVEMYAENVGAWIIHCHVGGHLRDGMITSYLVL